jgi:hypothetical protein
MAGNDFAPFVIQCERCQSIIGDSFSLVSAVDHLDAYALRAVQLVTIGALTTAGGSETIYCAQCNSVLGEVPAGRPEPELNGTYLLQRSAIKSYMLGAAQQIADLEQSRGPGASDATPGANGETAEPRDVHPGAAGPHATADLDADPAPDSSADVREELCKMKHMIIVQHSQIRDLMEHISSLRDAQRTIRRQDPRQEGGKGASKRGRFHHP